MSERSSQRVGLRRFPLLTHDNGPSSVGFIMYYYSYNPFNADFRDGMHLVNAFFDELANIHPRMSVGTAQTFLYVANNHDDPASQKINMTQLCKHLAIPYSSLMRHVEILGEGSPGKPGLNLIVRVAVPGQRKEQYVELSVHGVDLIDRIKSTFEDYKSLKKLSPTTRDNFRDRAQSNSHPVARIRRPTGKDE